VRGETVSQLEMVLLRES